MQLNYERARQLVGELISYKNENGEWVKGKIVNVRKDGLEISELNSSSPTDGYGFGFFGPRCFFIPFFGFPFFPFFF